MGLRSEARDWARDEFGGADLGDARRTGRLVSIAAAAAQRPSGLVAAVFANDAERQGAYDFLESRHISALPIVDVAARSCASRCLKEPFVYVPVDGTSLTIVDHENNKGFGHVGTYQQGLRGLKVVTAIAVSPAGAPIGVAHLEWWNRPRYTKLSSYRPPAARESQKWRDTIDVVIHRFQQEAPGLRLWFQLDREGDSKTALIPLVESGHWFTVRSQYNRRLESPGHQREYLRERMSQRGFIGHYCIDLPRRGKQAARRARLAVRSGSLRVATQNKWNRRVVVLDLNVVWVREVTSGRPEHKPLEWTLLTNRPAETLLQARQIIDGYCQRWRIEDFHRTWKSGLCNAEASQLRGSQQIQKWATILAAVAVRAERLKHLARTTPDEPASIELNVTELQALRILKQRQKKRTEVLPERPLTLQEAVTWIAQLGGYIHRPAQGPPGTKTIQRGLDRLLPAAEMLDALTKAKKMR
jgi:hypothetical protein